MSDRYTFSPIKALKGATSVGHALVGTARISMDRLAEASRAYRAGEQLASWFALDEDVLALYRQQPSMYWFAHVRAQQALQDDPPYLAKHNAKFDDDLRKGERLSDTDWMLSMPLG